MKSSLLKRGLVAGVAILSVFSLGMSAASALTEITIVGSDTTQNVMAALTANSGSTAVSGVNMTNVNAFLDAPVQVAADADCIGGITFYPAGTTGLTSPNIVAPNGSGAGRNALRDFIAGTTHGVSNKGCIDIARSSSFSSGSPAAGTGEYYAFGLDAVSWATASNMAPATLTLAQLRGIFNCTYTDWSEVGGSAGPIKLYSPTEASGTAAYFRTALLGFASALSSTQACPIYQSRVVGGTTIALEENRADIIPAEDWQSAIFPYSVGQWVYQANNSVNPTIDKRSISNGGVKARIGGLNMNYAGAADLKIMNTNGAAWNTIDGVWQLNDAGLSVVQSGAPGGYPIVEANAKGSCNTSVCDAAGQYPGVRFVYNVIDTRSPQYSVVRDIVGFDNAAGGSKSPLCSGQRAAIIATYGFAPLPSSGNVNGNNAAGSTCRKFTA